jgi:hypothetical protein
MNELEQSAARLSDIANRIAGMVTLGQTQLSVQELMDAKELNFICHKLAVIAERVERRSHD